MKQLHHAQKRYVQAPLTIHKALDRQVALLVENPHHPSLHAKKYDESRDIWQAG